MANTPLTRKQWEARLGDLFKPAWKRHGRKEPYTARGILRLPCYRCGGQAVHQWQICSDGNLWRPLCLPCDIKLNEMVLKWMDDPCAKEKSDAYWSKAYNRATPIKD